MILSFLTLGSLIHVKFKLDLIEHTHSKLQVASKPYE